MASADCVFGLNAAGAPSSSCNRLSAIKGVESSHSRASDAVTSQRAMDGRLCQSPKPMTPGSNKLSGGSRKAAIRLVANHDMECRSPEIRTRIINDARQVEEKNLRSSITILTVHCYK